MQVSRTFREDSLEDRSSSWTQLESMKTMSQWSLKALGTSQPRTYTTKESLCAALAHLNRTAAELVGLMSCTGFTPPPKKRGVNFTFWRPGNLNLALRRASMTCSLFWALVRTDMITWPMWTRATVPCGLPKAPRIPVWSLNSPASKTRTPGSNTCLCGRSQKQSGGSDLSAPAQDNILLMRITWKGCRRMRMWKPSLPQVFTMYLLAQIRAASRAAGRRKRRSRMKGEDNVHLVVFFHS